MPRGKKACRIPAEDEEHLILRPHPAHLDQRVHCVGGPRSLQLDFGDLESRLARDAKPAHLKALLGRGDGGCAVGWLRRGNENYAIEPRAVDRRVRRRKVAVVKGVESTAQQPKPHG